MKLKEIDEAYLTEIVYEPWPELSEEEKAEMEAKYEELLPRFINREERIIGKGGKCPMDILHDTILKGIQAKVSSVQRTSQTEAIREAQKQSDYLSTQKTICVQPNNFDAKHYLEQKRETLKRVFNKVTF
ncbi:hypothetical protein [Carboxylicivirga sp. RSCT41]|uniref:hypothetical protein n=1 Tax=Carboxylicivirga agarovorans TaxID=3417570 RepID=UPI003D34677E